MKRKYGYGYTAGPSTSAAPRKSFKAPRRTTTVATTPRPYTVVPRVYGNALAITERKYLDTSTSASAIISVAAGSWAGAELDPASSGISCVATGTDISNCIGRKFGIVAIRVKGYIAVPTQTNQTVTDSPSLCRILLVQDKQTNGVQLNAEDVIGSDEGQAPGLVMLQDPQSFGRFKVWKDKMISFDSPRVTYDGTNIEQGGMIRPFKWNIKFKKPIVVHRNTGNSTATIAGIVDNSFHIIGGTSDSTLAPVLSYKARCVFIDI